MRAGIFLLVALAAVCFVTLAVSQDMTITASPNSSRECAICHYEWTEPFLSQLIGTEIAAFPTEKEVSQERMCFSCHDGSVGDSRFVMWGPLGESHKVGTPLKEGMEAPANLPLVDGKITCMTCHSAHGTEDPRRSNIETSLFLRMPNEDSLLCKSCHKDMMDEFSHPLEAMPQDMLESFQKTNTTLELARGNKVSCTTCHRPHGAPSAHLLRASGEGMQLCRNCHEDRFPSPFAGVGDDLALGHIVLTEVDNVTIRESLLRANGRLGPNGELICFSCHTLHNSKGTGLLNMDNKQSAFCRNCHVGEDAVFGSSHNMEKAAGFKTVTGKTAMDVGQCSSCHGAHQWQQKMPDINADQMTRMCLSCHTEGGVAAKKAISWDKFNHYVGDIKDGSGILAKYPSLKLLPANTQKFLNRVFTPSLITPRTMRTESSMTCMTCHDIHGGAKTFLRGDAADGTMCVSCHEEHKPVISSTHGVSKLNDVCFSCHQVHNADRSNMVINFGKDDGCTGCHTDNQTEQKKKWVIGEQMPQELVWKGFNHPVGVDNATIFPLPMKQSTNGMVSCASCHNPHEAQIPGDPLTKSFLRTDDTIKTRGDFCTVCHDNKKGAVGSVHAMEPDTKVVANPRTGRMADNCDMCHKVHRAETEKNIFAVKGVYNTDSDFCTVCHNPDGEARDTSIDMMRGHSLGVVDNDNISTDRKYLSQAATGGDYRLECQSCHEPHTNGPKYGTDGDFATSFVRMLDPQKYNICVTCHTNIEPLLQGGHFIEKFEKKTPEIRVQMANLDACGPCHTMHNSQPDYLMSGSSAQARCQACHNVSGSSEMKVRNSHPYGEPKDVAERNTTHLPVEDGKIMCATCHEPHRAVKNLIRPDVKRAEELCVSCHEDRSMVLTSKHNLNLDKNVTDKKAVEMAQENACLPCHTVHNYPVDSFFMWSVNVTGDMDFVGNACMECHKRGGLAKDRVPEYLTHSMLFRMLNLDARYLEYLRGWDGKISSQGQVNCSTCHEPHRWSENPAKYNELVLAGNKTLDGDNSTSFLRREVIQDFCILCHEDATARYEKFHTDEFRKKDDGSSRGIFNKILGR